jgi:hypothetical protein
VDVIFKVITTVIMKITYSCMWRPIVRHIPTFRRNMLPPLRGYPNETWISVLTGNKHESFSLWPIAAHIHKSNAEMNTKQAYLPKPRYLIGFYNVYGLCSLCDRNCSFVQLKLTVSLQTDGTVSIEMVWSVKWHVLCVHPVSRQWT